MSHYAPFQFRHERNGERPGCAKGSNDELLSLVADGQSLERSSSNLSYSGNVCCRLFPDDDTVLQV